MRRRGRLRNGQVLRLSGRVLGGHVPPSGMQIALYGFSPIKRSGFRCGRRSRSIRAATWAALYRFTATRSRATYRFRVRIAEACELPVLDRVQPGCVGERASVSVWTRSAGRLARPTREHSAQRSRARRHGKASTSADVRSRPCGWRLDLPAAVASFGPSRHSGDRSATYPGATTPSARGHGGTLGTPVGAGARISRFGSMLDLRRRRQGTHPSFSAARRAQAAGGVVGVFDACCRCAFTARRRRRSRRAAGSHTCPAATPASATMFSPITGRRTWRDVQSRVMARSELWRHPAGTRRSLGRSASIRTGARWDSPGATPAARIISYSYAGVPRGDAAIRRARLSARRHHRHGRREQRTRRRAAPTAARIDALCVGAIDPLAVLDHTDDVMADFSGRGPTPDGRKKPDLVAVGVTQAARSTYATSGLGCGGTCRAPPTRRRRSPAPRRC